MSAAAPAFANKWFPDCAEPVVTGRSWYFDPIHGDTKAHGADGSEAKPFKDFSAVYTKGVAGYAAAPLLVTVPWDHYPTVDPVKGRTFADGPSDDTTRIQPGDRIVLATGNYGDMNLQPYQNGVYNTADGSPAGATKFVTIEGAPGAQATFTSILLRSSIGFDFRHIRVIAENTVTNGRQYLFSSVDGGAAYPARDIIIERSYLSSGDETAPKTWTAHDWSRKPRFAINFRGSPPDGTNNTCNRASDNLVTSTYSLVTASLVSKTVIDKNKVRFFSGDAIDVYSDNHIVVSGNIISDAMLGDDGIHVDCIQLGFVNSNKATADNPWHDILIERNTCFGKTTPDNLNPSTMQGTIVSDIFDNVRIIANKYVVNTCIGIGANISNSLIANNTIIRDGMPTAAGCAGAPLIINGAGTVVANNVVAGTIGRGCRNLATWHHNLLVPSYQAGLLAYNVYQSCRPDGRTTLWLSAAGSYDGVTILRSDPNGTVFRSYPALTGVVSLTVPDLRPVAGGPLDGTGMAGVGPAYDIKGETYSNPPNIGAYAY